jgi:hypothetical protein
VTFGGITIALVVGSISGVMAAGVVMLLRRAFVTVIVPWYQQAIYRGRDYSGEWTINTTAMQDGNLNLRQTGQRLEGECTLALKDLADSEGQVEPVRNFRVDGEVVEGTVRLNFEHIKRDRFGLGTMLLQVKGDGRVLHGRMVFVSVVSSRITTTSLTVFRPGYERQSQLVLGWRGPEHPPFDFDPPTE